MHFICKINEIEEGAAKAFSVNDLSIFAVKKAGEIYVYLNQCPHLSVELEWQEDQFLDPDGTLIQCSTHGALFLIESGQCISGPCAGDKLTQLTIHVNNDDVFLIV